MLIDHLRKAPTPCTNSFYGKRSRKVEKTCCCLEVLCGMDPSKLHIQNVYAELMLAYYQMSPEQRRMALMDVIRESVNSVKKNNCRYPPPCIIANYNDSDVVVDTIVCRKLFCKESLGYIFDFSRPLWVKMVSATTKIRGQLRTKRSESHRTTKKFTLLRGMICLDSTRL